MSAAEDSKSTAQVSAEEAKGIPPAEASAVPGDTSSSTKPVSDDLASVKAPEGDTDAADVKGAAAVDTEPEKLDEPAASTVPTGTAVNGSDLQPKAAPALQEKSQAPTSGPTAGDAANAAVEGDDKDASVAEPDTNGKRKADEPAPANGEVSEKKAKTDVVDDSTTNGHSAEATKAVRGKKEKKEPTVVGKTARRTRSQGILEV